MGGGPTTEVSVMVKDPVCGMEIEKNESPRVFRRLFCVSQAAMA